MKHFVVAVLDRLIDALVQLRERLVGPRKDEDDLSPIFNNMPKPLVQGVTPPLLFDGISFAEGLTSKDVFIRSRFAWKALQLFFMGENVALPEVAMAITHAIPEITPQDLSELMKKASQYQYESEQRNATGEAHYSVDFESEFELVARKYAEARNEAGSLS